MSFFSSLFGRSEDDLPEAPAAEPSGPLPDMYNGMTLDLETAEGEHILTGPCPLPPGIWARRWWSGGSASP